MILSFYLVEKYSNVNLLVQYNNLELNCFIIHDLPNVIIKLKLKVVSSFIFIVNILITFNKNGFL